MMMLACCIPMLLIVGALVVTGVAGTGAIVYALVCTAMMAASRQNPSAPSITARADSIPEAVARAGPNRFSVSAPL